MVYFCGMKNTQRSVSFKSFFTVITILVIVVLAFAAGIGFKSIKKNLGTDSDHSMHAMMQSMSARLDSATPEEFDEVFLEDMIMHHEGAVDMAQKALAESTNKEVRVLSQAIIANQNEEIELMKTWLDEIRESKAAALTVEPTQEAEETTTE